MAVEVVPFDSIAEVKEFNVLATAIESNDTVIWVGTLNGLVMVRPGEYKIFNSYTGHMIANHVSNIALSSNDEVWAALIDGGVFYFNQKSGEYYHLQERYPLDDLDCYDILFDEQTSDLFIACDKTFFSFNINSQKFTKLLIKKESGESLESYYSIELASNGRLVLGSWMEGLYLLDRDDLVAKKIGLNNRVINHIESLSEDDFIISTDVGVYRYLLNESSITQVSEEFNVSPNEQDIIETVAFRKNRVLIASSSHGLYELDIPSKAFFKPELLTPFLDQDSIGIIDQVEVIQNDLAIGVGADNTGLYILPLKYGFTSFYKSDGLLNSDVTTSDIFNGKVLISNQNNLLELDQESRSFEIFTENIGLSLFTMSLDNEFLVSTYDKGFVRLREDGKVLEENVKFKGLPSVQDAKFSKILQIDESEFLLGAERGEVSGVFRGDFINGFEQVYKEGIIIGLNRVSNNKVLITTVNKGVVVYDLNSGTFEISVPNVDGLFVDCVEQLEDSKFFLCLRRNSPLIFDLDKNSFEKFATKKENLRNIRDAALDSNRLLWITTSSGLFVYDNNDNTVIKIGSSEGIKSRDFPLNGILNKSKRLIIPGNRGIVEIDVDKAKEFLTFKKSQENKAFITKFDVVLDNDTDYEGPLKKDLGSPVSLPHTNIITRLQFSHDNFLEMEGLAFDVRMIGLNDSWSTLDVGEYTSTYTSLQPGEYEFQVRVNDPRSLELQPVESIRITVLPPWWKTNGAYASYFISLALAFYFFAWFRNKTLINQNKKLSTKVTERTATISRLLEQKQTFFANVSHEFRTPLSLIMGPLDSITDKLTEPGDKQNISIMRRNINRLMRLVDQILELAKFETSQSLPKQVYEVKASMQIIAASFASLLDTKQQKLVLKKMDDVRLLLVEDSFEMIMTNLISNAIKYCPHGSEVSVSMSVVDQCLVVIVSDNGEGIAPENIEVLFERFTRFDGAENQQGSGIGLALVKQLVVSNGGEIDVVSKLGEGTEFTIRLPLNVSSETKVTRVTNIQVLDSELFNDDENHVDVKDDVKDSDGKGDSKGKMDVKEAESANVSDESESQKTSQKYRLLVVEDNADLRTYIKGCLQDDYELDMAINGQEGLKKAQNSIPDLILSDVLMPVMDGYELANAIRTDDATSHIPIVLLTAKGDDLSRMKGWEEQVDDYLTKPFKVKELKARITRLLSIRDILRKKHTSEVSNNLATKDKQVISFQTKRDKEFFVRFEKLIDTRYADEHFTRAEAASSLALSERQLNRKLAALVDYNFSEYLRKYRLQKSAELLVSGHQVTQVAYDVGFGSPSYFSSCFKAEFGKTPRNYAEDGAEDGAEEGLDTEDGAEE